MVSEKTILAALSHPFIVTLAGTFQGQFSRSVGRARARKDTDVLFSGCASPSSTPKLHLNLCRCTLPVHGARVCGGRRVLHPSQERAAPRQQQRKGWSLVRAQRAHTHTHSKGIIYARTLHAHARARAFTTPGCDAGTRSGFLLSHKFHHTISESAYWR